MEVNDNYSFEEVGEILLKNLLKRLNKSKRLLARFVVRESDLRMQVFLSKQGFFAVKVLKEKFNNAQEDGYVMVKSCLE
jgi:ribosomal protein S18 acetylase RimI-like enzyme